MKGRNIEKRIYEILGVNVFRKYVLSTYDRLWKFMGLDLGYKIKGNSLEDLENFKTLSRKKGILHAGSFVVMNLFYGSMALSGSLTPDLLIMWGTVIGVDLYSMMTQRYHTIRINEIIERRKKLQRRHEEKQKENDNQNEEIKNPNLIRPQMPVQQLTYGKTPQEIAELLKAIRDEFFSYTVNQNNSLNINQPKIQTFDESTNYMVDGATIDTVTEKEKCLSLSKR